MHHISVGKQGEHIARHFCLQKKWQILHTNWRYKKGEIDIIAQDGRTTVFIEVKTRTNTTFGLPEESITQSKQRMLRQTISGYLSQNKTKRFRFDVISIVLTAHQKTIRHLKNILLLT